MEMANFLHPGLAFLVLAVILFFAPGRGWRWLLPVPGVIALVAVFCMKPGTYGALEWLGQPLTLGRVDELSLFFAQIFAVISVAGMLYAMHLPEKGQHIAACFYVGASFGCVFAGDLLTLFVFWELMTLGSTLLVFFNRTPESTAAAYRYFLYHVIGGLLLLAGIILRFAAVQSWAFEHVSAPLACHDWLILAGFCVNVAAVPLHAWLPDAYPKASFGGIVFMCACTTKTAVYALTRGFAGLEILGWAGALMAVYGVFYACIDNNARKILSYHIVSQVGYMVAGIGVGTAVTVSGALAHTYADSMFKALLFMAVGGLLHSAGTVKLDRLGGLAPRLPLLLILYLIGGFSISGVPGFNGFVSKTMTIAGAAEAHKTLIALALEVAAVGTVLSVGLKLPYFAFFGGKETETRQLKPIPWNMYAGMAVIAAVCIAQGLFPEEMLYRFLPAGISDTAGSTYWHVMQRNIQVFDLSAHPYVPWTLWHAFQSAMLIGFAALAFYFLRKVIKPHAGNNLDLDFFYRAAGKLAVLCLSRPLAFLDRIWGEAYQAVGLAGLLGAANTGNQFDREVIDGVVDGTARGVQKIGNAGASVQNGDLQRYIALALTLFFIACGLGWWLLEGGI